MMLKGGSDIPVPSDVSGWRRQAIGGLSASLGGRAPSVLARVQGLGQALGGLLRGSWLPALASGSWSQAGRAPGARPGDPDCS